ncbi:translation initiation factor eIF3, p33 subunit [Scheffersomyces stipitis CBS 6054]|uniref:Eukaryotic translation initiation factor 3 subunit G n=1 Tax=Scheffersomyces stipitis (strain ATCC 58785 / CBS 6054 / NBRC 10063 / NRRL Y-11545) TaxID=322104 RepID=EIF3G_PICST|nr:translation initiation factor eIF3, p33 subunit [Scheffersomyces stipitis CBS 6054]A3GGU2.2 RecName: Full=Eukaryotic translation initiation factor 3 subunit G; Short=eIF3g; AltName: Full=Eukaryotic translation initiation factor 3 RNA-binding subunit; Short=eIF-3 RNA-binding subunit; AltName: Full=Translation initiation factor eIF3 p33 subunit homolog; Short=eIF3 p33 homolog [Scheffersomyces stipitis CBS 6054]EAZ63981.2 translation initiation factor eIF3, p33 subunit [Scheffersomyces stipitis C
MSTTVIGSWADAGDEFSAPDITTNPDGTKTVITYRTNQDGKKVKITQKIKEVKVQERVHPLIAQRKNWKKYGKESKSPPGPDTSTTQLGEKVELKLGTSWKQQEKEEEEEKAENRAQKLSVQTIRCRTCGGDHYTSKCPFKDTLGATTSSPAAESGAGDNGPGKYVPRHLRADANGNLPSKEGRDDSTTLKVSQLNSFVDEDMLRNELFARFGPLQRVTLVRNRETGDSRGFAYVSFITEDMAQRALDALNGKGYHSLILHLEWSKKKKTV